VVHGQKNFHSVSPLTRALLIDKENPTVWAREMAVLDFCGCTPEPTSMEEFWTPNPDKGASPMTLTQLLGAFRRATTTYVTKFVDRKLVG